MSRGQRSGCGACRTSAWRVCRLRVSGKAATAPCVKTWENIGRTTACRVAGNGPTTTTIRAQKINRRDRVQVACGDDRFVHSVGHCTGCIECFLENQCARFRRRRSQVARCRAWPSCPCASRVALLRGWGCPIFRQRPSDGLNLSLALGARAAVGDWHQGSRHLVERNPVVGRPGHTVAVLKIGAARAILSIWIKRPGFR